MVTEPSMFSQKLLLILLYLFARFLVLPQHRLLLRVSVQDLPLVFFQLAVCLLVLENFGFLAQHTLMQGGAVRPPGHRFWSPA